MFAIEGQPSVARQVHALGMHPSVDGKLVLIRNVNLIQAIASTGPA
jgi:hypothetical protein